MRRYHGGEKAARGTYVRLATLEVVQSTGGEMVLSGGPEAAYVKTPAPLVVLFGPLAGLAFIIFLPFAGIVGIASLLAYKTGLKAGAGARHVLQTASVTPKPGMAHLTRPVEKKAEDADHGANEDLSREIEERRRQGEQ